MRRLLTLTTLLFTLAPATAHGAEAGLNLWGADNGGNDESTAMLADTGAKWSRHFVQWYRFEPAKGVLDTALVDAFKRAMDKEAAVGVKNMLVVVGAPSWANGSTDPYVPPTNAADFASFMERLSQAFAGKVEVFEIWNEQDEAIFWKGAVSAGAYTELLKQAYPKIKAADPNIKVAFGPTTGSNYNYVQQAYEAGAKGSFDAISVHTDTACAINPPGDFYKENGRIGQFPFLGYREVRATMLANGDDKPIYMSELGWSTTTKTCDRGAWAGQKPAGVSEAKQAAFLSQAFHCLKEDPYVEIALWFEGKDRSAADTELTRYGLRRPDGKNKPSYDAFKDYAKNGDKLIGPCGDFAPPKIVVKSPTTDRKVFDKLVLAAETPDKDVARMSFLVDGVLVENFTPNLKGGEKVRNYIKEPAYRDWQGVRKLTFGPHTVTVVAKDISGNEESVDVPFVRVDPSKLPPQRTEFAKLKLVGSGAKRVLSGKLVSPGLDFGIVGKVQIVWQAKRKGGWKKIHGGAANANKAFRFKQQLRFTGQWRVRVEYGAVAPYQKSATPWVAFTVKK